MEQKRYIADKATLNTILYFLCGTLDMEKGTKGRKKTLRGEKLGRKKNRINVECDYNQANY